MTNNVFGQHTQQKEKELEIFDRRTRTRNSFKDNLYNEQQNLWATL